MDNILNNIFSTYDFFLFEVFAVPIDARKDFQNKLLTRKGSVNQKNVRFLRYIYKVLEKNKMQLWDEDLVCKELGISGRMLDCYKSRILKSLREHYFDWENRLEEIKTDFVGDDIDLNMRIAEEMFCIGMVKEAKHIYIKTEYMINRQLKRKNVDIGKYHVLLSEIFLKLTLYYFYQRDLRKFNSYYKKAELNFEKSQKNKAKLNLNNRDLTIINISFLKTVYYKTIFKTLSGKSYERIIEIMSGILKEAEKINSLNDVYFACKQLGIAHQKLKEYVVSTEYLNRGYELAKNENNTETKMVFDVLNSLNAFFLDNKKGTAVLTKTEKYYFILKNNYTDFNSLLNIQNVYLRMLIFFNKESSDEVVEDFIGNLILFSQKAEAISKWYLELSDRLASSIYKWEAVMINTKEFSFDISVNKHLMKSFEDINYNTLYHFNKFYSQETLAVLYLNQIDLEFWKGRNCNYENAIYFIKKLEQLIKKKHVGTNPTWMISSRIGVNIFEDLKIMNKKEVLNKHYVSLKQFIEKITSEDHSYNIFDDFAKLIFISKILKVNSLTSDINKLGEWIGKNHPELIKALLSVAEVKKPGFQVA